MPVSVGRSIAIIVLVALATFATRAVPFVLFPPGKPLPKLVVYLGRVLPFAVIGMLVVYCLKTMTPLAYPYGLPELIAVVAVVLLHLWKRNNLLSIGVGTVIYMVLIQVVFV